MLNKNLKTTKHNIMTAILINTINDFRAVVHSTTEHPSSSYGIPVWVDKDNEAYMQVGATTPFYKVIPVDTLDQLASYINDYARTHDRNWPDGIHEICDLNGWENLDSAVEFCQSKFTSFPNIIIVENLPNGRAKEGLVVWANDNIVL